MLEADWEACERGYYAGELRIQEKELRLYTKCNAIIAKHAAFFALIAYSALSMTPHWLDEALTSQTKKFFFYNFVVVAIGFNMLTMVVTSWCMIFGPGLAIRGPPGSMKRAVEGMRDEEAMTHLFFALGQVFLTLAAVALGFLKLPLAVACCIAVILVLFLGSTLAWYMRRPRASFSLTDFDGDVDFEALMLKDLDS
jgi:hypothetical protein